MAEIYNTPARTHERSDVSIRALIIFMVILALFGLATYIVLGIFWRTMIQTDPETRAAGGETRFIAPRIIPPEPRLQASPPKDWDKFVAAEQEKLNSYGWVDQQRQTVRVPIGKAIEAVASQNLPYRDPEAVSGRAGAGSAASRQDVRTGQVKPGRARSGNEPAVQ